jgi:hypothetical protein
MLNGEQIAEDQRDVALFMLAARWPDDIRDNPKYNRPQEHYINFGFKPEGQPESLANISPAKDNILTGYRYQLGIAKSKAPDEERAIALCWLFHLIGDVHQPLHTVALVTETYPKGDRGGNDVFVRAKEGGDPIRLHAFWDGLVIGSEKFRDALNRSIALRNREDFRSEKLDELGQSAEFELWAKNESFKLACEKAYRNGKLEGSTRPESAPVLPADYVQEAKAIGDRRVVLSGYRLATVLKSVVE